MNTPLQNDFDALLPLVLAQAKALHIPVSAKIDPHVMVNTRATGRFGCCKRTPAGYVIELSHRLLYAPRASCLQTLAHEVLHTCPGCANHAQLWKRYAAQMNAAHGYRITRTGKCEELGVAETAVIRYRLVCTGCGAVITRSRRSRLVQYPQRYRCRCGGALTLQPSETPSA